MIDPAGIPVIAGNMDALAGHATAISDTGRAFADTGAAIHNTWQGLYPHYIAPESGQLLSATGIIATTTASVGEDLGTAGTALTTYADEVRVIQAALVALQDQAKTLVADRTAAGDDWASDSALVERDTALIDAVNAQVAAFTDAERRCANALRVLYGAPLLSVDNGDGVLDPATEYGFTAEQLDAAARNGGTPWGATSEVDHAWPIDVLHGVGSFFGGCTSPARARSSASGRCSGSAAARTPAPPGELSAPWPPARSSTASSASKRANASTTTAPSPGSPPAPWASRWKMPARRSSPMTSGTTTPPVPPAPRWATSSSPSSGRRPSAA